MMKLREADPIESAHIGKKLYRERTGQGDSERSEPPNGLIPEIAWLGFDDGSALERWSRWLALFGEELMQLHRSIRPRLKDNAERWSLVFWGFLQTIREAERAGGAATREDIRAGMRKAVYRELRVAGEIARRERRYDGCWKIWDRLMPPAQNENDPSYFQMLCDKLRVALEHLDSLSREALDAVYARGLSERVAAAQLGLSRSALKRRLERAKKFIADELGLPLAKPSPTRRSSRKRAQAQ